IGFAQARLALAQGFDLAAEQLQAGLDHIDDLVVVARPAIVGDDLPARLLARALGTAALRRHRPIRSSGRHEPWPRRPAAWSPPTPAPSAGAGRHGTGPAR